MSKISTSDTFKRLDATIQQFVIRHQLIPPDSTIIVGLSGGPDSVFLLHWLAQHRTDFGYSLIAAHLDHEWRATSTDDAAFCTSICQELGVPLVSSRISQLPTQPPHRGSQEDFGRACRLLFFGTLARQHPGALIALGHHRNDQQETFFIRLMRGASLTGLAGMRPRQGNYIRPLLEIDKTNILSALVQAGISYAVDPTNTSDAFLRNKIRATLLPAAQACDPRFETHLNKAIDHIQDADDFLNGLARTTLAGITVLDVENSAPQGVRLDVQALCATHPFLQPRLLLLWLCTTGVPFTPSAALFAEIMRFLNSPEGGTHWLAPTWGVSKKQGKAWVVRA